MQRNSDSLLRGRPVAPLSYLPLKLRRSHVVQTSFNVHYREDVTARALRFHCSYLLSQMPAAEQEAAYQASGVAPPKLIYINFKQ